MLVLIYNNSVFFSRNVSFFTHRRKCKRWDKFWFPGNFQSIFMDKYTCMSHVGVYTYGHIHIRISPTDTHTYVSHVRTHINAYTHAHANAHVCIATGALIMESTIQTWDRHSLTVYSSHSVTNSRWVKDKTKDWDTYHPCPIPNVIIPDFPGICRIFFRVYSYFK